MDLLTWVYIVAIIYMILWIGFLLVGIALLWKMYDTVRHAPQKVQQMVSMIIGRNKGELLGMAGMAVVSMIAAKMKGMFRK